MNQNINVDLIPKFAVYGNLYFSQYDVGREAIINLVNGSTEYEIPSGATVTLAATKPSGLGFTQNCTFDGNQITVVCTAEMTDEAGHFPCELRIANGSLLLGTANFTFNVERSPHPEGTTDGTADSVISQITVAFESAMTQIENSGGLTNDIKEALLNCFQKVAWIDDQGQTYYDALEEALYNVEVTGITLNSNSLLFNELNQTSQLTATLIPSTATVSVSWESSNPSVATVDQNGLVTSVGYGNAMIIVSAGSVSARCSVSIVEITVTSLNAVLNASGHVFYVGDDVNDVKDYLTVTASFSDGTTSVVPSASYTLSGSLMNEGANVITVSYGGQTTTVTVNAVILELLSISAAYTQSGTVYDNQTLDSLKSDLVVTASWSDSSTTTLTASDYTLSGTLATGTSAITVSYGGKTDTFDVTVTHATVQYTITNTLTQCTNSNNASVINELTAYSGTLTANSGYVLATVTVMMGNADITSTAYDSSTNAISIASVTGNIVITAEAVEDVGWISGVPYTFTITNGYRVDASTFELVEDSTCSYVELPCKGVDYLERYWSQFGGSFRMDFYDANDAHLQANTATQNGTHGCTVSKDATKVIISGVTGRMQNLTVTPYGYPELGENTVWEANTIYVPEESTLSGTTIETGYMFGALAETISISIGYATSSIRGQYMFYDQNKNQISSTATAEIIGGTGIWRTPVSVPEGTYYVKVFLYNSSVYFYGNALDNIRIVYNRTV